MLNTKTKQMATAKQKEKFYEPSKNMFERETGCKPFAP
jgi:hypothetical protein